MNADITPLKDLMQPPAELLPLSLLNDFLFCNRRAALKIVEGWRSSNEHTARGDIIHDHADLPGYEVAKGVTLLRALPVWSERLGLNGKCDIVEVNPAPVAAEVARMGSKSEDGALKQNCHVERCVIQFVRNIPPD